MSCPPSCFVCYKCPSFWFFKFSWEKSWTPVEGTNVRALVRVVYLSTASKSMPEFVWFGGNHGKQRRFLLSTEDRKAHNKTKPKEKKSNEKKTIRKARKCAGLIGCKMGGGVANRSYPSVCLWGPFVCCMLPVSFQWPCLSTFYVCLLVRLFLYLRVPFFLSVTMVVLTMMLLLTPSTVTTASFGPWLVSRITSACIIVPRKKYSLCSTLLHK